MAAPDWLAAPADVNALVPQLWPASARKVDGVLEIAGRDLPSLAAEFGTPLFVCDEDDFRARARRFRDAFDDFDVFYAGKAFLSVAVARWVREEGLNLDVCTAGELAVAEAAGFPMERVGFHGNNKSRYELDRAVELGVGRIIVDSFEEIDRLAGSGSRVMVRVTAGVEAHTHEFIATAHEDQKFGFSIASGQAMAAVRQVLATDGLELVGLHSHIGSQIFDVGGWEIAARRVIALLAQIATETGVRLPELDLGGGFGIAYTTQDDPTPPDDLAASLRAIVERECAANGIERPHLSIEPGRAIVGPSMCTVYEVGTVKQVHLDGGAVRTYVSVDGGMSDNPRPPLYGADYSATVANRIPGETAILARVVGKHCESGDIVVRDEYLPDGVAAGDLIVVPGTGAYNRSMASNYNHVPRPPVISVRDGGARLMLRRETLADLLRLDADANPESVEVGD